MTQEVMTELNGLRSDLAKERELIQEEAKKNAEQVADLVARSDEHAATLAALQESMEERSLSLPGAEEEAGKYQVTNLLRCLARGDDPEKSAPLEWDLHKELVKNNEEEVNRRLASIDGTRSLNTLADTKGGFFVPEELSSTWYENFREMDISASAGFTKISPSGIFKIPKKTASTTAYRVGENEAPTASDISMGLVKLEPHALAARSFMTLEQMVIGDPRMETMNRRDLGESIVLKRGYDAFYGTGADNQPLGIYNTSGVVDQDLNSGTAGDMTYDDALDLIEAVRTNNALIDDGSLRFIAGRSAVLNRMLKQKGTSNDHYIFRPGSTFADMLPHPALFRNDFPSSVTDGVDVFFGRFSEVIQASWGGIHIAESTTATDGTNNAMTQGGKHLVIHTWDDTAVIRPESIVYSRAMKFQN